MRRVAAALCAALLALLLIAPAPALAQPSSPVWWSASSVVDMLPGQSQPQPAAPAARIDYAAWEALAGRAEAAVADSATPSSTLVTLRGRVAESRQQFLEGQNLNAGRIATLREQIAALGPAPVDGQTEPEDIAARRAQLGQQLTELSAPGIAAGEAFRRADGIVREIDRILRERQADALMQLLPSPLNPGNWPAGITALTGQTGAMLRQIRDSWAVGVRRERLSDNLPVVIGYALLALILLLRGRSWMARLTLRLHESDKTHRWREVWALLASTGQVLLPVLGVLALVQAAQATAMSGVIGNDLLQALPAAGFVFFAAIWLGGRIFPHTDSTYAPLGLPGERRREGRFHSAMLGLILSLDLLRMAFLGRAQLSEAASSVIAFPLLALAGLLLFRIGQLMRLHHALASQAAAEGAGEPGYYDRLINFGGRAAMVIGIGGGALAAIGYVPAATALVYPAIVSLALAALLVVLQRLVAEVYAALVGAEGTAGEGLIPVLTSFALTLVSLPLFALIWGVRDADLFEVYARFREGFSIGDTRISPTNFLTFVIVFVIGFTLTRLIQGALGNSVLPRTRIDRGAQKSLVAGLGYIGVFLAALIGFSSAGIDLSSLALVAGALSVGIGFGMQNIVSNFVSGIILLVERPISEGDWIEVGGTMGVVRSISVRSTVIETFDKTDVIVPNADLITGRVTNWTHFNQTGRVIVPVGVAYGTDTRMVERILLEIAQAHPLVVLNPVPSVMFLGFGNDSLNFDVRAQIRDITFKMRVISDINHEIARRFQEEGVEIPFPQRDLWLRNPEALGQALGAHPRPAASAAPDPAGGTTG